MASRAQKGLWPTIGFISEQKPRCPMVVFGAISATNLALMARARRFYVFWFKAGGLNCPLADEMLCTLTAGRTNKKKCFVSTLVYAPSDFPVSDPPALLARVVRPLKSFNCH